MKKKIAYLEGMRGVAALIVVIAHVFQLFLPSVFTSAPQHTRYEPYLTNTPLNLILNGNFAVCLFFILSGYVLSHRFFRNQDEERLKKSARKRYLRLAIPAFISVVIPFVLIKMNAIYLDRIIPLSATNIKDIYHNDYSISGLFYRGFIGVFFHNESYLNPVLWTMTYELMGSILVFFVALTFAKSKYRWALYGLLFIVFYNSYYLAFLIGLVISDVHATVNMRKMPPVGSFVLLAFGWYFASYPYVGVKNSIYEGVTIFGPHLNHFVFYHIIGAALLFLAVLNNGFLQWVFSLRFFAYLGRISFSMYLLHFPLLLSFTSFFFLHLHAHFRYGTSVLLSFLLTLPLLFFLSHFFCKWVDERTVKQLQKRRT